MTMNLSEPEPRTYWCIFETPYLQVWIYTETLHTYTNLMPGVACEKGVLQIHKTP